LGGTAEAESEDLREIGVIPIGHRRRLLDAIAVLRTGSELAIEPAANAHPAGRGTERAAVLTQRKCRLFLTHLEAKRT